MTRRLLREVADLSPRARRLARALSRNDRPGQCLRYGHPFRLGSPGARIGPGTRLSRDAAYPVAVATAAAGHGIPLRVTLEAFSLALVQTLVSATIRLSALGHSDGQRVIAALLPRTQKLARRGRARDTRRYRRRRLRLGHRGTSSRNPIHEAVPLMTKLSRPPARRHRRPGRLRQDGAHGGALQDLPRQPRHHRHHQRYLHQGRRAHSDARRRA